MNPPVGALTVPSAVYFDKVPPDRCPDSVQQSCTNLLLAGRLSRKGAAVNRPTDKWKGELVLFPAPKVGQLIALHLRF